MEKKESEATKERGIDLFHAKNYVKVKSLDEAYELNQKKANAVIGGMLWLKMSERNMQTAIDLSGLGLDVIDENEEEFVIGCMCTLRQLEKHDGLNRYFGGAMKDCTKHIVGIQFRNSATVGGSIFGRFGFSDILTCLLALDTYVELHHAGVVALSEFVDMPRDNDILVNIIIKKDGRKISYQSHREAATDFPVIACAVSRKGDDWFISVGARSGRAQLVTKNEDVKDAAQFAECVVSEYTFSSNMRGSGEYRRHLAEVYVKRAAEELLAQRTKEEA